MSTGIQPRSSLYKGVVVRLIENLGTGQGVPADGDAATVLKARPTSTTFFSFAELYGYYEMDLGKEFKWPDGATIRLYETAGSGTMTISYARLWLYDAVSGKAFPAGVGTDADKGKLNNGGTFGETASDKIRHSEPLLYPGHCDGIQVELGTIGGTNPTFNVDLYLPE